MMCKLPNARLYCQSALKAVILGLNRLLFMFHGKVGTIEKRDVYGNFKGKAVL